MATRGGPGAALTFVQTASLPDLEDGQLVERVRQSDIGAFETLFFAYYDRLATIARRDPGIA